MKEWSGIYDVGVARLADGKLSVRIDDAEVALLPRKVDCTDHDVERMLVAVCMAVEGIVREVIEGNPEEIRREVEAEVSW